MKLGLYRFALPVGLVREGLHSRLEGEKRGNFTTETSSYGPGTRRFRFGVRQEACSPFPRWLLVAEPSGREEYQVLTVS